MGSEVHTVKLKREIPFKLMKVGYISLTVTKKGGACVPVNGTKGCGWGGYGQTKVLIGWHSYSSVLRC